jgi:hypothetical protein
MIVAYHTAVALEAIFVVWAVGKRSLETAVNPVSRVCGL